MNSIDVQSLLILKNVNIIDIRAKHLFNKDHIPNAINIVSDDLTRNIDKYLNKNDVYYIYCEFGYQSKRVGQILTKLGYKIFNLKDGYYEYEQNKR